MTKYLEYICGRRRDMFPETVSHNGFVELKNITQVEHSRHRSFDNFFINTLGAVAAYCYFPKKPCVSVCRVFDNQLTLF